MENNNVNLYDIFINYSYSQLKDLFKKAKTKEEKDFTWLQQIQYYKENKKRLQVNNMETYTIFAGVNRAGKTSIYKR